MMFPVDYVFPITVTEAEQALNTAFDMDMLVLEDVVVGEPVGEGDIDPAELDGLLADLGNMDFL